MGYIEAKGVSEECLHLLKLGEIIGVGKQTVFGLGKIRMEDMNG
ncbi:MAG: CRISPR system precrRNA processing endoribonuclease RAMP protein Cas6 [Wolinella sp.]